MMDEFSKVRIGKITGDIIIQANSIGFERVFSSHIHHQHEVMDELILKTGYNVESDSHMYILYYHHLNAIKINLLFGSGFFQIKQNDSNTLVDLQYNHSDHSIMARPKNLLGTVMLEIFDETMFKSQIHICYIFIVHCVKAKLLLTPSIFQESDFSRAEFWLYDSYDHLIPSSQFHYLNLSLDVFTLSDLSQREMFKITRPSPNNYLIQGFKAGVFRFILMVQNTALNLENYNPAFIMIMSNEIEAHIYEKLTTIPSNLLLAPGCICHMEIIGGPSQKAMITSNIELKIRISQQDFIHLSKQETNLYLAEGKLIGSGKIFFELYQRDYNLTLSSYEVNFRIELVNNIEIQGFPERKVYLGATFRLMALSNFFFLNI